MLEHIQLLELLSCTSLYKKFAGSTYPYITYLILINSSITCNVVIAGKLDTILLHQVFCNL